MISLCDFSLPNIEAFLLITAVNRQGIGTERDKMIWEQLTT